MATEQFCLRWNDFHANITAAFSEIKEDEDFLDVTLVCDGDMVRAHKLVLSACSPLFRVMLKKNSHPQPMIFLRGIRFPDMVAILNFMYHGEVNVNQEDLQMFLAAAEELRIKGLSQASNEGNLQTVPKKKLSMGGTGSQPPMKKAREGSPGGGSPASSGPGSARSPGLEDGDGDAPQLAVKREFASGRDNPSRQEAEDEDGSNQGQGNLLDCLMQAGQSHMSYGGGNSGGQGGFEQNNFGSPQHLLPGGGGLSVSQNPDSKGLWWGSYRLRCGFCDRDMKNEHSLNVHVSRYHNAGSVPSAVPCPVCRKTYSNQYSLRTHMHIQHKDQLFLLGEKKRGRRPRLAVPETSSATPPGSASIPPQPMLALTAPQATGPVQPSLPKAPQAKDSILDLSAPKTN